MMYIKNYLTNTIILVKEFIQEYFIQINSLSEGGRSSPQVFELFIDAMNELKCIYENIEKGFNFYDNFPITEAFNKFMEKRDINLKNRKRQYEIFKIMCKLLVEYTPFQVLCLIKEKNNQKLITADNNFYYREFVESSPLKTKNCVKLYIFRKSREK